MRKLLIVSGSMSYGGAEIQTLELANGLIDLEYAIDMVVLNNRTELIDKAGPEIRFHIMGKTSYLDFAVVRKLRCVIAGKKPDIILCVDLYPMLYLHFALGPKIRSYSTATVFHSTLPQNFKDKFKRWFLVPITKSSAKIIFVSNNQKQYWVKNWNINPDKSVVIYNGIDIELFESYLQNEEEVRNQRKILGFGVNDIVIGTCSNFRPEKRQQDLIEVCALLKGKGYPVKVLIIGDGHMRSTIEEQIQFLGLQKDVVITGYVSDVRPYLAAADIFVLTSSTETLSIAAIESQAMKKAAVLSNTGGASEIVNEGINGFLYPVCDLDMLLEKLETILKGKKWKAMGEAGHLHAKKYFNRSQMIQAYNRLFREMSATLLNKP